MAEIKDIFLWYRDLPVMPRNLTTIQQEQWQDKYNASLLKQPFVGQPLSPSPAVIQDIGHNIITTSAFYSLDYHLFEDGTRCTYHKNTRVQSYAYVSYSVSYEKEKYLGKVNSFNIGEMVELSGVIKSAKWLVVDNPSIGTGQYQLAIELSLSSINKTESRFLHAELLDDTFHYKETGCFIATAAFGADDCVEVTALRSYRDNCLSHGFFGRAFIRFYYRVSPSLSQTIGASCILRGLTRSIIRMAILPLINQQP